MDPLGTSFCSRLSGLWVMLSSTMLQSGTRIAFALRGGQATGCGKSPGNGAEDRIVVGSRGPENGAAGDRSLNATAKGFWGEGLTERLTGQKVGISGGRRGIGRAERDISGLASGFAEGADQRRSVLTTHGLVEDAEVKIGETRSGNGLASVGGLVHVVMAQLSENRSGDISHGSGLVGNEDPHGASRLGAGMAGTSTENRCGFWRVGKIRAHFLLLRIGIFLVWRAEARGGGRARSRVDKECPGEDLNLHALAGATTSR